MVRFEQLTHQTKIPAADYVFSDSVSFLEILDRLTPKLEKEQWNIVLVDPELSFILNYMDNTSIVPSYVDCVMYLPKDKMDAVFEQHPELTVHKESNWDLYLKMVHGMSVIVHTDAYTYLYRSAGPSLDDLKIALDKLSSESETGEITLADVKRSFVAVKRIYASDVFQAFYTRRKDRWTLYKKYVDELGIRIAYYAMRKFVTRLLNEKYKYLQNQDVKERLVSEIDAPFICKVYALFMCYESYHLLPAIMYQIDNARLRKDFYYACV